MASMAATGLSRRAASSSFTVSASSREALLAEAAGRLLHLACCFHRSSLDVAGLGAGLFQRLLGLGLCQRNPLARLAFRVKHLAHC